MLNRLRDRDLGSHWRSGSPRDNAWSQAQASASSGAPTPATAETLRAAMPALLATAGVGLAMWPWLGAADADPDLRQWLWAMLLTTGIRLLHVLRVRRSGWVAPSTLRPYLVGVGINALIWTMLPWMVAGGADPSLRLMLLFAACGAAGVQALALCALPTLAIAQAAICLLPSCAWLLGSTDRFDTAAAAMGMVVFAALVPAVRARSADLTAAWMAVQERQRLKDIESQQRRQIEVLEAKAAEAHARAVEAATVKHSAQLELAESVHDRTVAWETRTRELARQANTDTLTGLPNRKGINEHLAELLAPMADFGSKDHLALLFLDLDDFKDVNDQHGHLTGDSVLRLVADRLRESLPRSAFAARWGGDEFIVVLPGMGRVEQIRLVAETVRSELRVPIRLDDGVVRVGCSIGIAMAPYHGRTPEALIIAADHAVYAAKTESSDRVRVFDVALAKKAKRQHQLAQALPSAQELGQLEVAYQPIVAADTAVATHVEALARWKHPRWGAVSPGEFIPVAESSGQIHTMGRWMLRQACLDAARWPGAHPPKVSVNVSALQVNSGHLVAQVREALAVAKLPAHRLMIELTESLPMARSEGVSQTLSDLRAMGVTLAIDDFGTGYSSLSSLMKQPLSLVKVDQSFVRDVPGEGEVLIRATIEVARCFGLQVVAEGVETPEQQQRLATLGVGYMQGYLFGRPMPHHEFMVWLALRDGSNETFALRA